jgi:hypothetical protein
MAPRKTQRKLGLGEAEGDQSSPRMKQLARQVRDPEIQGEQMDVTQNLLPDMGLGQDCRGLEP